MEFRDELNPWVEQDYADVCAALNAMLKDRPDLQRNLEIELEFWKPKTLHPQLVEVLDRYGIKY